MHENHMDGHRFSTDRNNLIKHSSLRFKVCNIIDTKNKIFCSNRKLDRQCLRFITFSERFFSRVVLHYHLNTGNILFLKKRILVFCNDYPISLQWQKTEITTKIHSIISAGKNLWESSRVSYTCKIIEIWIKTLENFSHQKKKIPTVNLFDATLPT